MPAAARCVRDWFAPKESGQEKGQQLVAEKIVIVVAALELELAGIRRALKTSALFHLGEAGCEEGWIGEQACLLVQCGMGRQRAERTLRLVLEQYQPAVILSLGFCGALAAKLRP